jgi:Arc/MetJ-type ribon-helix-helix transcriptional regulator
MGMDRRVFSMTIHLSKDQERFVHDAVRAGLYTSEDAVVSDALERLKQAMPKPARASGKKVKGTKPSPQKPNKPMTEAEFDQHLLRIGLITALPDPALDLDDDDPADMPVTIKGEPLSKTIIRDRR